MAAAPSRPPSVAPRRQEAGTCPVSPPPALAFLAAEGDPADAVLIAL